MLADSGPPRVLRIQRAYAETDDQFEGVYWEDGRYLRDAMRHPMQPRRVVLPPLPQAGEGLE